jgi:iduronate 2-sulfatase
MVQNKAYRLGLLSLAALESCSPGVKDDGDEQGKQGRMNVILIAVDDLRTELGFYGNNQAITPNFDRLASSGIAFMNTYCQAAVSAPSRASLMTGLRPDSNRVWHLGDEFRKINPDIVTMPQYFKQFGYHTVSIGKIFHNHMPDSVSFDEPDLRPEAFKTAELIGRDAESFYVDPALMKELDSVRAERIKVRTYGASGGWAYGVSVEATDAEDSLFYDGAQTELAIRKLREISKSDEPFYLALGYFRPHLPFSAPLKYWNMYDREKIVLPTNNYLPVGSPVMAADPNYELNACYDLNVKHPLYNNMSRDTALLLKHGYLASVSFIDACLGKLLDELESLDLLRNTVIVLYGDNGWKLGEHNAWCKQTDYMPDINVPMIISSPGMKRRGIKCEALTELIDIYPTICDAANVPKPGYLQGTSLTPLFDRPQRKWKSAAFSQIHRLPIRSLDGKRYMGYSMVTERWHYVKWYGWDADVKCRKELAATELYDLRNDPEENKNLSVLEGYGRVTRHLERQFTGGWQHAVP